MSSVQRDDQCPNCDNTFADYYEEEDDPFPYIQISCNECGLYITPDVQFMSLDEVNEERIDFCLSPLTELKPKSEIFKTLIGDE